jgi:hypothetical protein
MGQANNKKGFTKQAETPQYDLPGLRGKQRRKDFLAFCDRILGNKALLLHGKTGLYLWTGEIFWITRNFMRWDLTCIPSESLR